jgi:hypothetical protein
MWTEREVAQGLRRDNRVAWKEAVRLFSVGLSQAGETKGLIADCTKLNKNSNLCTKSLGGCPGKIIDFSI